MSTEGVENIGGWFLLCFCLGFMYGVYYFSVVRQPPRPMDFGWISRIATEFKNLLRRIFYPQVAAEELETLNQSKMDLESAATTVTGFGIIEGSDREDD